MSEIAVRILVPALFLDLIKNRPNNKMVKYKKININEIFTRNKTSNPEY